ncbi:MAG TPA: DUF3237 family protein, partial [Acidimicrobiia bacterium]
ETGAEMADLEKFCIVEGDLSMNVIGATPAGMRIDFPFAGTATGPHWQGARPVSGVDYVTVRADGNMDLDIHGVIGEKREKVAYRAIGVSIANPDGSARPKELLTFQTAIPELTWLNDEVGVAFGSGAAGKINLEIFLIKP